MSRQDRRTTYSDGPSGSSSPKFVKRRKRLGAITALIIVGVAAGSVLGVFIGQSASTQSTDTQVALGTFDLSSMPTGYTPQVVLDSTDTKTAEKETTKLSEQLQKVVSDQFDLKFDTTKASSNALPNGAGKDTMVYSTMSATYTAYDQTVQQDKRQHLVDIVNAEVQKLGYSAYDATPQGPDGDKTDPLKQEQVNITGSYIGKDASNDDRPGDQYSVQIIDVPAKGDQPATKSVVIYFLSYPHLKPGTEGDFKSKVVSDYRAQK